MAINDEKIPNNSDSIEKPSGVTLVQMLTAILQESQKNGSISQALGLLNAQFPEMYNALLQGPIHPSYQAALGAITTLYASISIDREDTPKQATKEEIVKQDIDDYIDQFYKLLYKNGEQSDQAPYSALLIDTTEVPKDTITAQFLRTKMIALQKKFHPDLLAHLRSEQSKGMGLALTKRINTSYDKLVAAIGQQRPQAWAAPPTRTEYPSRSEKQRAEYLTVISKAYNKVSSIFTTDIKRDFQLNEPESYVKINSFLDAFSRVANASGGTDKLSLQLVSDRGKDLLLTFLTAIFSTNSDYIEGSLINDQTVLTVRFMAPK